VLAAGGKPAGPQLWVSRSCPTERPDPMLTILLIIVILLLLFGGGWGYRRRGL
jgi:hypothetical protein